MANYYLNALGTEVNLEDLGYSDPKELRTIDLFTTRFRNSAELREYLQNNKCIPNIAGNIFEITYGDKDKRTVNVIYKNFLQLFNPNSLYDSYERIKLALATMPQKDRFYKTLYEYIKYRKRFSDYVTQFEGHLEEKDYYSFEFNDMLDEIVHLFIGPTDDLKYKGLRDFASFLYQYLVRIYLENKKIEEDRKRQEEYTEKLKNKSKNKEKNRMEGQLSMFDK